MFLSPSLPTGFGSYEPPKDYFQYRPAESSSMKCSSSKSHDNHSQAPPGFTREEFLIFQQQQEHQAAMGPRSSSEMTNDTAPKFRQLPCRTFISVGTCPYRERCVYLHDPRIICREAKTKTRRKNKEDTVVDSLFWPIMPYAQVASKLDNNRQPHVIQNYIVPAPQSDQFYRHDQAVFSMWMHFVDFCSACAAPEHLDNESAPCFQAPDIPVNAYTKVPRLPIFRALSTATGKVTGNTVKNEAMYNNGVIVSKYRTSSPTTVSSNMMSPFQTHQAAPLTASNLASSAKSLLPPTSLLLASKQKDSVETSSLTSDESFTNSNCHSLIADLDLDEDHKAFSTTATNSYSLF